MPDVEIHLEVESQRTSALLKRANSPYVPLAVAAAVAFHQAYSGTPASISQRDYEGALDIAAAALSRLIPVYTLRDPQAGRATPLVVDLARARFARGATELRDGADTVAELSVARNELLSALSLLRRIGLPLSFAGAKHAG
jgi:hypothetical protein